MGTAPLAAASLEALSRSPAWTLAAAVTQPDRPKGRDLKPQPSAVKSLALRLGLPVLQPDKARDPIFVDQLRALRPDLIVVAAYGQILPSALLELPRFRCVNVHASLLPRYRGAAPIQWAILNDDGETGITIMQMEPSLDTGPLLSQQATPIRPEDDAQTLHDRLAEMGADLLVRTIPGYVDGTVRPRPQPTEGVTHARKITKEDGQLDWSLPARALWNRVRGLVPWPSAYGYVEASPEPFLLKIWQASPLDDQGTGQPGEILQADRRGLVVACGQGALRILSVQRQGGRRLAVGDFLAGHAIKAGQRFTAERRI